MWNWIEISKSALDHNIKLIQELLGIEKAVFVLKSNAYGHGLKEIFTLLKSKNLPMLCTNYVSEALSLRSFGYKRRIMVVGPFLPEDLTRAYNQDIELCLGHKEGLEVWLEFKQKPKVHIEFDTGMSRQGFHPSEASDIAEKLSFHKDLVKGVCMHFSNIEDVTEHTYADTQLDRFNFAKKEFTKRE
ncbi:MAG: alanine racemase, partial [Proteobacteria bacterium]|nr:alanine racemase [Pseudomonadota bacterium]